LVFFIVIAPHEKFKFITRHLSGRVYSVITLYIHSYTSYSKSKQCTRIGIGRYIGVINNNKSYIVTTPLIHFFSRTKNGSRSSACSRVFVLWYNIFIIPLVIAFYYRQISGLLVQCNTNIHIFISYMYVHTRLDI